MDREELYLILLMLFTEILETKLFRNIGFLKRKIFFQSVLLYSAQYKARHAHKRLYTVLPKYSKIQVLPGITSCRLMKYNKQAIELNSLLNK